MKRKFTFELGPRSERILSLLSDAVGISENEVVPWALSNLFQGFCEASHFDPDVSLDCGEFISIGDIVDFGLDHDKPTGD